MPATLQKPSSKQSSNHAPPASRASWSGQLALGQTIVPVKAYSAVVTTPTNPLRQLHSGCGQPIEYRKCCGQHGEVPKESIVKGFAYTADDYVELSDDDLAGLQADDDKTIHLERFFSPEQFDLSLLSGRSLHLVPAHQAAGQDYALILQSLGRRLTWALGQVVFSGRTQLIVVRPAGRHLMLHVLFWPAQQRTCPDRNISAEDASPQQVRELQKLIAKGNGQIHWSTYADQSEGDLMRLIQEKIASRSAEHILPLERKRKTREPKTRATKKRSSRKTASRRVKKAA